MFSIRMYTQPATRNVLMVFYACLPKFPHLFRTVLFMSLNYDIPSDVVADIGPDTSQNVAYGVTKKIITTPNPTYDVIQR